MFYYPKTRMLENEITKLIVFIRSPGHCDQLRQLPRRLSKRTARFVCSCSATIKQLPASNQTTHLRQTRTESQRSSREGECEASSGNVITSLMQAYWGGLSARWESLLTPSHKLALSDCLTGATALQPAIRDQFNCGYLKQLPVLPRKILVCSFTD